VFKEVRGFEAIQHGTLVAAADEELELEVDVRELVSFVVVFVDSVSLRDPQSYSANSPIALAANSKTDPIGPDSFFSCTARNSRAFVTASLEALFKALSHLSNIAMRFLTELSSG